jgi:hypothetical protein
MRIVTYQRGGLKPLKRVSPGSDMFKPTLSDIREPLFRFFHDASGLSYAARVLHAALSRDVPTSLPGLPLVRAVGTTRSLAGSRHATREMGSASDERDRG